MYAFRNYQIHIQTLFITLLVFSNFTKSHEKQITIIIRIKDVDISRKQGKDSRVKRENTETSTRQKEGV